MSAKKFSGIGIFVVALAANDLRQIQREFRLPVVSLRNFTVRLYHVAPRFQVARRREKFFAPIDDRGGRGLTIKFHIPHRPQTVGRLLVNALAYSRHGVKRTQCGIVVEGIRGVFINCANSLSTKQKRRVCKSFM